MQTSKIKQIFSDNNLPKVISIKKIEIGWTNEVYSINEKFILKICKDLKNEKNFEREYFFYNFFKNKIPVPKVILFDKSKKIYNKIFMIYHKIQGDNLYSKWHVLNNTERKNIVKQLCGILKKISNTSDKKYIHLINWHDKIITNLQNSLKKIQNKKNLSSKFIQKIKVFIEKNHHFLNQQKNALVYFDPHFDNIIIKNNKIIGILDLERTDLASLDYTLDIIKRMVEYPKKYVSEKYIKYIRRKDYSQLLKWFKEFYPELFEFKNLDKRLDLYSLENSLSTLLDWPHSKEVKQMIAKIVNF
jgi:aminoglycoside phosphotransferase (APT) family kinase protein